MMTSILSPAQLILDAYLVCVRRVELDLAGICYDIANVIQM